MTYEVIILGHLHMPLYFIGTFTEYPYFIGFEPIVWMRDQSENLEIVFQKVCKSQIFYFCNGTIKNEYLWNLHMNKSRK